MSVISERYMSTYVIKSKDLVQGHFPLSGALLLLLKHGMSSESFYSLQSMENSGYRSPIPHSLSKGCFTTKINENTAKNVYTSILISLLCNNSRVWVYII